MVRVVRTPSVFKDYFTPDQLNGWPSGFSFAPSVRRKKKRKPEPQSPTPAPKPSKVIVGRKIA